MCNMQLWPVVIFANPNPDAVTRVVFFAKGYSTVRTRVSRESLIRSLHITASGCNGPSFTFTRESALSLVLILKSVD